MPGSGWVGALVRGWRGGWEGMVVYCVREAVCGRCARVRVYVFFFLFLFLCVWWGAAGC